MGVQNLGSQVITFNYKQPATGEGFSQLLPNLLNQGIYSGFQVQNVTATTITLTPGSAVLYSYDTGVTPNLLIANSIKTTQNATISGFSSTNVYCVLRYQWSNVASNYMDILAVSTLQANDVVVCKLIYTGSNVTDIDYSYRTFGNLDSTKYLYDYSGTNFYINPGTKFWYISNFSSNAKIISYYEVNQKITTGLTAPGSSNSYYVYFDGTSFGIATVASITATYNSTKDGWYSGNTPDKKLLFKFDTDGSSNIINVRVLQDTILSMTSGGTGAQLTPSNGGILYSTNNTLAILAGTVTASKVLMSGSNAAPTWSTATYPTSSGTAGRIIRSDGTNLVLSNMAYLDVCAQGDLLYGSASNTMASLTKSTTANSFLKNSGTSNNPAWATIAAVDLSNGTTGSGAITLNIAPNIYSYIAMFNAGAASSVTAPTIYLQGARNTIQSPQALQTNDFLAAYQAGGHDGTNWVQGPNGGAELRIIASENWTSTKHGCRFEFWVTTIGATNDSLAMTLTDAGALNISGLTASQAVFTDSNKSLVSVAVPFVVANGGTGLSSWTQGDLPYYNTGTVLSKLAKSTTANSFLKNSGTSNNPAWATIAAADLSNGTTGSNAVVLASSPTITTPTITQINTGIGDFQLNQNTIVPFYSYSSGAVNFTLVLNSGKIGVGGSVTTPAATLAIGGNGTAGQALYAQNSATLYAYLASASYAGYFQYNSSILAQIGSSSYAVYGQYEASTVFGHLGYYDSTNYIGCAGEAKKSSVLNIGIRGTALNGTTNYGGYFAGSTYDIYLANSKIGNVYGETSASGIAVLINSSGVLGTTTSSIRYKENIQNIGILSNKIYDFRPVSFNYKKDLTKQLNWGLIAEEVYDIIPEMVLLDEKKRPETVFYQFLPILMLNELQKHEIKINSFEERLKKLENI